MIKNKLALLASIAALAGALQAKAQIDVSIYSGHGTAGGGAPYSGLVGSFDSPDIAFGDDTVAGGWHPFGLDDFGARLLGCLGVEIPGIYTFSLHSDDGSLLYIDGSLVVDNGGPHSPATVADSTFLAAGVHPFKVEFYEDFGGESTLHLTLPAGVFYVDGCAGVPDGGNSALLLSAALVGIGLIRRRIK